MNVQQIRVIGLLPRATLAKFMFQIMNHDRDACPVLKQNKERTREAKVLLGALNQEVEGLADILLR